MRGLTSQRGIDSTTPGTHYDPRMSEPSEYELNAWQEIQRFRGRPLSHVVRQVGDKVTPIAAAASAHAAQALDDRPRAKAVVAQGKQAVGNGVGALKSGTKKLGEVVPDAVHDWGRTVVGSGRSLVARVSRVALSPERVVRRHQKQGHDVNHLAGVRKLDLEQVDAVRGRAADWYYPALAALSGAGSSFAITGGTIAVPVSGGAAAAPSALVVTGAFVGDATVVLGLSSRCVGQVALHYGYDPEDPGEKFFIMSVINAGTAMSSVAKQAAMADISRLTQALVRGKTWAVLEKSVLAQISKRFTNAFVGRLTKQSLGKIVPVAGVIVGGTLNWTTLESIVDSANRAYRRRFLLEKYPSLIESEETVVFEGESDNNDDVVISVIDTIREAGGPDIE